MFDQISYLNFAIRAHSIKYAVCTNCILQLAYLAFYALEYNLCTLNMGS